MPNIIWEMGRYSVERGVVGKLELFSLTTSTRRDDPSWILSTTLPGIVRDHRVESQDAGKAKAEQLVRTWLRLTGLGS